MKTCNKTIKFHSQSLDFLRKLLETRVVEISGSFQIKQNKDDIMLYIDPSKIVSGNGESTEHIPGKGTFHTHPREAYMKYNVKYGMPSNHDYLAFLSSTCNPVEKTIFHIVVSLEGLYIITLGSEWCDRISTVTEEMKTFVMKEYMNFSEDFATVETFIQEVNSVTLKDDVLFNTYFVTWDEASVLDIKISYKSKTCEL